MATVVAACSVEPRPATNAPDRTLSEQFAFSGHTRTWTHHRSKPKPITACSERIKGARLCVAAGGEVWIDRAPFSELAPQQLTEDLLDAWYDGQNFLVLGKSGSVYVLRTTDGSVERILAPPFRIDKVTRLGSSLLGLAQQRLHRSDDAGASWQTLRIEPQSPIDIAVDGLGLVALLEIPERLWQSTDGARHFSPLESMSQGVTAFVTAQNQIRKVSILGGKAPLLPHVTESVAEPRVLGLDYHPAEHLGASDFLQHRVIQLGDRYLVARPLDGGWKMLEGTLGRPLEKSWVMRGLTCHRVLLAAVRAEIWALCSDKLPEDVSQTLRAHVSRDEGHRFERIDPALFGVPKDLVALSTTQSQGLLVSGLCPPERRTAANSTTERTQVGCRPRGLFRLERATASPPSRSPQLSLQPISAPALSTSATALETTASGQTVVAVAKRTKTGAFSLLISKDAGRSFSARSLSEGLGNEAVGSPKQPNQRHVAAFDVVSLSLAEDGAISLVTKHGDQPRLYSFDPEGTLLSAAIAPGAVSRLSAFEEQSLAFSRSEGVLYESVDRGANFEPIVRELNDPCLDSTSCEVVCRRQGCLIGDRLTRLGYRHSVQPRVSLAASVLYHEEYSRRPSERSLAHCELSRDGWQRVKVHGPLPSAISSSFGPLAFYWLALPPTNAANVQIAEVPRGERKVVFKRLFSAATLGAQPAVALQRHSQGWAAALVRQVGANTEPIGLIDFAWADLVEGHRASAQARFRELTGSLAIEEAAHGPRRFAPGWLFPTAQALLVQLTPDQSNGAHLSYLVSPSRPPQPLEFGGWQGIPVRRTEVLAIAGHATTFALAGQGMVLLRGSFTEPTLAARTIAANPDGSATSGQCEFAQLGHRPGALVRLTNVGAPPSRQQFLPIVLDDSLVAPGIPIPAPFARAAPLVGCTSSRRSAAERIVVDVPPADSVELSVVRTALAPLQLVSKRVVLYLDAMHACWDVVEASDEANGITALLFADEPAHAWLFRTSRDLDGVDVSESASMACRFSSLLSGSASPPAASSGA